MQTKLTPTRKHRGQPCPQCGKNHTRVRKVVSSSGKVRRVIVCFNPACRSETR